MADPCARARSGQTARSFSVPDDILICAFELLGLSNLRSAAGVSRQFYAAAWRSGLYIRCSNRGVVNGEDMHLIDRESASWNTLVDHALQKGLLVGFTLIGARLAGTPAASYRSALRKMPAPITRALPILVSLSITVEVCAYPELCAALQGPAPYLRSLLLRSCSYQDAPLGSISSSTDLFSGNSPVLTELGLDCRSLGHDPIAAFSNVVRFSTWRREKSRQVPVARHFPMLRHLMLSSDDSARDVPPRQLDLSRTKLRSLVFHDLQTSRITPLVDRTFTVAGLPVFHHHIEFSRRMDEAPLCWPVADSGSVAIHIPNIRGLHSNIRHAASDGAWRSSYVFALLADRISAYTAPGVVARLEYLRITLVALWDLTRCAAVFQTLRRLRVDLSDVDDSQTVHLFDRPLMKHLRDSARSRVRCPVLECVAILWYSRAPEEPVTLHAADTVVLGRALGADAKPVLELGDVDRERPLSLSRDTLEDGAADIEDLFSSVRRVPCAFGTVLDQFDGDLWNDNVAVKMDRYLSQSLPW